MKKTLRENKKRESPRAHSSYEDVAGALLRLRDSRKASISKRFFKCGKGEYGEGDDFLGVTVPQQRKIVKEFGPISENDVQKLLVSPYHEFRLTGLLMVVLAFHRSGERDRGRWYRFYIRNRKYVNNWDLVDVTTPNVLGEYLVEHPEKCSILAKLSISKNIWERRMSILATFSFLRRGIFSETIAVAETLLHDQHDLIQKAVGWMLREIGKRDRKLEEEFLDKHAVDMPRTMLRYAVERFPNSSRRKYMKTTKKK